MSSDEDSSGLSGDESLDDLGSGGGDGSGSGSESEGSNSPSLRRDGSRKRAAQRATPAQPSKRGAGDAVKNAAKVFVRGVMSVERSD